MAVRNQIAFFGPQYGLGGAGRVCSDVGKALARKGFDVDFLVDNSYSGDSYLGNGLPKNCRVVQLSGIRTADSGYTLVSYVKMLYSLVRYLRKEKEVVLISSLTKFNLLAVWGVLISQVKTSLVLIEHSLISTRIAGRSRFIPPLVRVHYPFADEIIAVSTGVATDLYRNYGISTYNCEVIRNPVDLKEVTSKSKEKVDHDWFRDDVPVIVGVGRLVEEKQFSVLLESFERLTHQMEARLVIIGDGPLRENLSEMAVDLRIEDTVDLIGFVSNPYRYIRRADLLVISSRIEGHPVVALEALACGTSIVGTNCPGGLSDILNDGEYGELVDVGDSHGLAEAMARTLENPPDPERLVERAQHYRVDKVADRYTEVIERVAQ